MSGITVNVVKVFELSDRVVLVTDLVGPFAEYKHGSTVELACPDGKVLRAESWLEVSTPSDQSRPFSFSIGPQYKENGIVPGTRVVLAGDAKVHPPKRTHKIS